MYITEKQVLNWEAKHGPTTCRICGERCTWLNSEYSFTRRRELVGIHRSCYNEQYFGIKRRDTDGQ